MSAYWKVKYVDIVWHCHFPHETRDKLRVYRSTPLNQLCMALQPNSRFKGFPSGFQGQQKTANHSQTQGDWTPISDRSLYPIIWVCLEKGTPFHPLVYHSLSWFIMVYPCLSSFSLWEWREIGGIASPLQRFARLARPCPCSAAPAAGRRGKQATRWWPNCLRGLGKASKYGG
jgi:hypothetical protein